MVEKDGRDSEGRWQTRWRKDTRTHTHIQKKWGSLERCLRGDGLTYGQQTTALGGAGCVCACV